jgi:hypothetical protein
MFRKYLMNIIILWKVQLKKINIIFYLIKDHNILIMKEMLTIKLYKNFHLYSYIWNIKTFFLE